MALPIAPRTDMWLNVSCCTNLPKITKKMAKDKDHKKAEDELQQIKNDIAEHFAKMSNGSDFDKESKTLQKKLAELEEKQAAYLDCPIDEESKIIPNPFVVVAVDDDDEDRRQMLHTKAIRGTTNPIWKEKFEQFPLEMYVTGKMGYEQFVNGDKDYLPQNLVFMIYHDDAVPDSDTKKPKSDEDSWKRDKPSRKLPIGRAEWEFRDLCRKINCAEFERDLPILDPNTHKKIKDAYITVTIRLCAPKIVRCMAHRRSMKGMLEDDYEMLLDDVDDTDLSAEVKSSKLKPKAVRKKILIQSKQPKSCDSNCLCTNCLHVPFQKPVRRLVRQKQVRFRPTSPMVDAFN